MQTIKDVVRKIINEAGPSKSFNKMAASFQKEALKYQQLIDVQKGMANEYVGESDPVKKEKLKPKLIDHSKKVKAQEIVMNRAEHDMMMALQREPVEDVDESNDKFVNKSPAQRWTSIINQLDKKFPNYDADKVKDYNLVKGVIKSVVNGIPDILAGEVAQDYHEYRRDGRKYDSSIIAKGIANKLSKYLKNPSNEIKEANWVITKKDIDSAAKNKKITVLVKALNAKRKDIVKKIMQVLSPKEQDFVMHYYGDKLSLVLGESVDRDYMLEFINEDALETQIKKQNIKVDKLSKTLKLLGGSNANPKYIDHLFNTDKVTYQKILDAQQSLDNETKVLQKLNQTYYSKNGKVYHESISSKMKNEDRDYKAEYKKYGKSERAKKYRAELNQYNRKKGTYGNGDGLDASHKGGKIVGFEKESVNRGRAEKSRLKKESVNEDKAVALIKKKWKDYNVKNKTNISLSRFYHDVYKKSVNESMVKWQDVEVGDSANVKDINKTGVIVKSYGRKFHLKFANGNMKTYDANDLTFIKDESISVNEIDFATDGEFQDYASKHDMRDTTKVTVAGKETTAGEASGSEEGDAEGGTAGGEENKDSKSSKVSDIKDKIKGWSAKEKEFFKEKVHLGNSPERRDWGKTIKDKTKGVIAAIKNGTKHEIHEFKQAGKAIQSLASGAKLTKDESKALKSVAIKVTSTALFGAVTGGLSHGVSSFASHVAKEFIPHVVGETVLKGLGKAALFAGKEDESAEAQMQKFMDVVADNMAKMEISPEQMEAMIDSYNANKSESVNEGELEIGDGFKVTGGNSLQKLNKLNDTWKVVKKDFSTYTLKKKGSSMTVRHLQSKVDSLISDKSTGQDQLPFVKESVNEANITFYFDEDRNLLKFSDGEQAKIDYDGEFKYKGKWFDTSDIDSADGLEKMLSKSFKGTKFTQSLKKL